MYSFFDEVFTLKQNDLFSSSSCLFDFTHRSIFPSFWWPCLCWLSLVPSTPPPLFSTSPSPFILRARSEVTNYSERAEKVVWTLPSGLPGCIIVKRTAGMKQPLAADTTSTTSALVPTHTSSNTSQVEVAGSKLILLHFLSCWTRDTNKSIPVENRCTSEQMQKNWSSYVMLGGDI